MSTHPRTVLVTGGGSGIGRATAEAFVDAGESVVVLGRTERKLRETAAELGDACTWQRADVSDSEAVNAAVSTIVDAHESIDVLVNNAGFVRGTLTDMELSEAEANWDAVVDTNLKGSYLMAMVTAPHFPRPGGRIINVSSIAARTGGSNPGAMAYAAAKAGLHGLTFGLARELSPEGITVNAVAPGFIANTEFTGDWSTERIQGIVAETPIDRAGTPDDIAAAITYLASSEASFITGEVLDANGGWVFGR